MKVWGITGLIGSGKSTAVKYLAELGYEVVDADQVSRLVVDRNTDVGKEGFEKVYRAFGSKVLDNLGNLDRGALRKRMMAFPHERQQIEAILHPLILGYISKKMTEWKANGVALAFVEGSRLIESGFHNVIAGIIVVTATEDDRVKRLVKRDSMGKDEVRMMVQLQDEGLMRRFAKVEWKNDKTVKNLQNQIDAFVAAKLADKS